MCQVGAKQCAALDDTQLDSLPTLQMSFAAHGGAGGLVRFRRNLWRLWLWLWLQHPSPTATGFGRAGRSAPCALPPVLPPPPTSSSALRSSGHATTWSSTPGCSRPASVTPHARRHPGRTSAWLHAAYVPRRAAAYAAAFCSSGPPVAQGCPPERGGRLQTCTRMQLGFLRGQAWMHTVAGLHAYGCRRVTLLLRGNIRQPARRHGHRRLAHTRARGARTMHVPCAYYAHAMHMPCAYHAHGVHMPCICRARAMHMPYIICAGGLRSSALDDQFHRVGLCAHLPGFLVP